MSDAEAAAPEATAVRTALWRAHRSQLTTLLSQVGCDPGVTDLVWMPSLGLDGL